MKNKVINALQHRFSPSDRVVFDANVLVSLFSGFDPPDSAPVRKYSRVLKEIRQAGSLMLLDVLVLSEFVNVCVRKHRDLAVDQGAIWKSLKDFRKSPDFPAIASHIAHVTQQIVNMCNRLDHLFSQCPITELLNEFSVGQSDINDQLIVELCKKENAFLLTNDTDFTQGGITVLTTHPKLLAACQ